MTIEEIEIIRKALDTEETHKDYVKNVTEAKAILNKQEKVINVIEFFKTDIEQSVCELCEKPLEKVLGKVCENTMCERHR